MQYPRLQFDPAFVEETVFLYMREDKRRLEKTLLAAFHQRREDLYNEPISEKREQAFRLFYEEYFIKLGLREVFERVLTEFPLLSSQEALIYIKKVHSEREEESELYVSGNVKTVFIGLRAVRISDEAFVASFLRFELMHAVDMLDAGFCYCARPHLEGETQAAQNLHRARFRFLWNTYVDARLQKKGFPAFIPEEKQRREFEKLFYFWDEARKSAVWQKVKESVGLTQADLLDWAAGPSCSAGTSLGG